MEQIFPVNDNDTKPRLLIDLNSLLNAALLGGTDKEGVTELRGGDLVTANSASYGIERFLEKFAEVLTALDTAPRDVIGVWDGAGAKGLRQGFLPSYKKGREKDPLVHEQLELARTAVNTALRALGAHTVSCATCEADDVLAYLVQKMRSRPNIVVSGDGDMAVLVDGGNTRVYRPRVAGREATLDENPFGPFPHRFITVYKALVGDKSDGIPGAKGFGDAAFLKLVKAFGIEGLEQMETLIKHGRLSELQEDVAEFKPLQKIIDHAEEVGLSWHCASLYPDRVNSMRQPLRWVPGFALAWNDVPEHLRVAALKQHYATRTLVHLSTFEKHADRIKTLLAKAPFIAADTETSTSDESEDWKARTRINGNKGVTVDVLGSVLTGFSLTFGENMQHSIYVPVRHAETEAHKNVPSAVARALFEAIPQTTQTFFHNRNFDFTVLFHEWGKDWMDNGWHGFVPNALDTRIEASYVEENLPLNLKGLSRRYLGYEQATYQETTGGRQMRELTGDETYVYAADDTRATASLHTWFRIVMEIEGTWDTYLQVEQLPEYLTTQSFIQGVRMDQRKFSEMRDADAAEMDQGLEKLRAYLLKKGWNGAQAPTFEQLNLAAVRSATQIVLADHILDEEGFVSAKRSVKGYLEDVEMGFAGIDLANVLVSRVRAGDLGGINALVREHYKAAVDVNFGSTVQMRKLLYEVIGIKPRVFIGLTPKQKADKEFAEAYYRRNEWADGTLGREPTAKEWKIWMGKASTDDDAIKYALHMDTLKDEDRAILGTLQKVKELMTRQSLFYNAYEYLPHWTDSKIHPSFNQSQTVTRRYSSSNPNFQQLPGHGDGVKFRSIFTAPKDWIYASLDWSGQELRLMADRSQDANMLACYIGDDKKDIHSLVAARASIFAWGQAVDYPTFMAMRKSPIKAVAEKAKDLRTSSKTTNFATQYDAAACKVSILLLTDVDTAQKFIDAKNEIFPGVVEWKKAVSEEAQQTGLSWTMLGVPRHLSALLNHGDSGIRSRALRQAGNYRIQGSGAEMAKIVLARLWKSGIFTGRFRARFVAPIHDEIMLMVHKDDAWEVLKEAHDIMKMQYADMRVPLESSVDIGLDFTCPIELGEVFDQSHVEAAIAKLYPPVEENLHEVAIA